MSQTWNGTKKETPERRTYTVDDIAQILGIGRTSAYIHILLPMRENMGSWSSTELSTM